MASGYEKAAIGVDEHWNEINPSPVRDFCIYAFVFIIGGGMLIAKAKMVWDLILWMTSGS